LTKSTFYGTFLGKMVHAENNKMTNKEKLDKEFDRKPFASCNTAGL
jgi:hypothetical protein